jgi:hypothetical protein
MNDTNFDIDFNNFDMNENDFYYFYNNENQFYFNNTKSQKYEYQLKTIIFKNILKHGNHSIFEFFLSKYHNSTKFHEKDFYLNILTCSKTSYQINYLLHLSLNLHDSKKIMIIFFNFYFNDYVVDLQWLFLRNYFISIFNSFPIDNLQFIVFLISNRFNYSLKFDEVLRFLHLHFISIPFINLIMDTSNVNTNFINNF